MKIMLISIQLTETKELKSGSQELLIEPIRETGVKKIFTQPLPSVLF